MSYPSNIPATRAVDAPEYDQDTVDSNLGLLNNNNITRIMWDKHGPITEPNAFEKSAKVLKYKCVQNR